MGNQEDPNLRSALQIGVEMTRPSKEKDGHRLSLHPTCSHVCPFSTKEHVDSVSDQRSKSAIKLSGLIIFYMIFMAIEVVGGIKANSLAVLTDAAHLLVDIAGFSISLLALWASSWNATSKQSFGFHRLEVLGALLSVQLIWLICGILIYEAVNRILHQNTRVNGKLMVGIAALGFLINFVMVMWLGHGHNHGHGHGHGHTHEIVELHEGDEEDTASLVSDLPKKTEHLNINLQGAYLHVVADMIQSIGVMVTGGIIWAKPDWLVVDLVCTIVFSLFALITTLPMLSDITSVLMERTPSEIDITGLESGLKCIKGVQGVHDLHVWAITHGKTVLACHVIADVGANSSEILVNIKDFCETTYGIHHVTIQIEQGL